VDNRATARSGVVLLLVGLVALAGTGLLARQRAAARARAQQQAADVARGLEESAGGLKSELGQELEQVADIPQLRSAIGNRADAVTFRDLFQNEDWWAPYRQRSVAVIVGGDVAVTQNLDASAAAEGARRARGTTGVSLHALESRDAVHVVAAGSYRLQRDAIDFMVLLGRPFDRALLEKMRTSPAVALALSDGRRVRTSAGDGEIAAVASTLVGREAEASFAPAGADWTAAAVPVADKLWVLGLTHRSEGALPLAAVLGCGAVGAALTLAGVALILRRRRRRADVEVADAPAAAAGDGRPPSFQTPSESARGTPTLAVVPPGRVTPSVPEAPGMLAAATALAAEGGQQFGRYRLLERIGEGGMAEVFTAVLSGAEGFERLVVIKRLKPHLALNPEAVAQFIDEAKMGSQLAHSNIVTVSDFGKVGDGYYLAEEFVDGRTLAQIAVRYREKYGRTVPIAIVYHVVHEVLVGIAYAHERADTQGRPLGIVHRDVSPTNIMVSFEGEVKLLDFGIVKATERVSKTREGNVKGNVGYMSPEQARGLDVTGRSDLFSLGLVMFELLSGEPFYQGGGAGEVLYQAATGPTVDHLARIAKLPAPAPEFLRRVLAMDPASRYPSARAFAHALTPSATMVKGQLAEMMRALFHGV
jgi:type II secretory pathway pseudopilin PulG